MTIDTALTTGINKLKTADIGSPRLDSQLCLAHVLQVPREHLLAHPEQELSPVQADLFKQLITQRAHHIPLVHLTGHREFYGLELEITPNVLTPRVETEQMVDWAIQYALPNSTLIDIGTGSGAIAAAIASHRPDLIVSATEVEPLALEVAKRNAIKHKLKINFIQSNLFQAINGRFDTVVTNLPYLQNDAELMPEVLREPKVALFGGPEGLDLYHNFFTQLPDHLHPSAYVFTECDPWQQDSLIAQAHKIGLKVIEQGYFILGFQLK